MPNVHSTLTSLFSDIADAIRAKTGGSGTMTADSFPSAIAAIPSGGGAKPSYLLSNGDTVSTFYFNGEYDLDTFLAGLSYADTDPNTGLGVCAIGLGYLFAVNLTGAGLTGEYALVENDGVNITILYTTSAVPAYGVTAAGWQNLSLTPAAAVTVNMSSIVASFVTIIDSVAAKDDIAFGSHGGGSQPQLNAPSISISQNTLTITNPSTNGNFVTGYKVFANGTQIGTTANTTYDLSGLSAHTAAITVKAVGTNFADSAASNSASFTHYYTVEMYDDDQTTLLSTQSVAYNHMPTYSPAKMGYTFDHWIDGNGNRVTQITENTSIFAVWIQAVIIQAGQYNVKSNLTVYTEISLSIPFTYQGSVSTVTGTALETGLYGKTKFMFSSKSHTTDTRLAPFSNTGYGEMWHFEYYINSNPMRINVTADTTVTQAQKTAFDYYFTKV